MPPSGGFRIALLGLFAGFAYVLYTLQIDEAIKAFCSGPGSYSRIVAAVVLVLNWKSLPFAWNFRIWHCMIMHLFIRDFHTHTPDKLFHPVISESHASIGEIDYRWHKSNSTYLADLDISRSHLVSHLVARAGHLAARNSKSHLVMDPSDPIKPARGSFNIGIGAVHCAWKREIRPYQKYEMWSRIITWDRKWLFIMTHFVEKGAVKPGPGTARTSARRGTQPENHETLGRLTIHPAIMLEASGLLPDRPGGWTVAQSNEDSIGEQNAVDMSEWTWKRTEAERQRGLKYARHFAAMDDLHGWFDGGDDGALGQFPIG
ncbi:hypothetical protein KJ359_007998 [Pestalotiopsis sp. 9143b]|nr:hypothetical protein KJ359_007998 [Pestalotiopsis sp. 9143b]